MRFLSLLALTSTLLLTACVPDIYLIDRQTVLELEASGQWPELDQKYKEAALKPGPAALEKTRDSIESRQIFSMTHDDKVKK
ncbi:MAG: hypothetical protein H7318_04240 [Oligoflexus sp.]|nr:hypothetical protein [Oligoflexus sp.]